MEPEEYRRRLREEGVSETEADARAAVVRDFECFLASPAGRDVSAAGIAEAEAFARRLIAEGRNTPEALEALADHARRAGRRSLQVAWIELADCHNALETLAGEIERRHGRAAREEIFPLPLPPLGAGEQERCAFTLGVTARMARILRPEESRAAWFRVQHGIPQEVWRRSDETDREEFRRCGNLDEFLARKRRARDDLLSGLHARDELWYTVRITAEVLEFVRSDPEMEGGFRRGENVYITKIPYNAERYLRETDPVLRRYYACHCPLARQAILEGGPVSPDVCQCSLGHASHYLAGIGRELAGEVLESAVRGDLRCRFVFRLPAPAP